MVDYDSGRVREIQQDISFDAGGNWLAGLTRELMEKRGVCEVSEGIAAKLDDAAGVEIAIGKGM